MTETVTAETLLLTYEDYRQLPDDGKRYELIEGEMHMIAAPTTEHQRISFNASAPNAHPKPCISLNWSTHCERPKPRLTAASTTCTA